jgi:hypothetical protein
MAAGVLLSAGGAAMAQTDPSGDAQQAVAAAESEADRAADQYFEQLARFETLDVEIAATERRLHELKARVDELRERAQERAALAYVRSGENDIEFGWAEEEQAFAAARRTELLGRLNESDSDVVDDLRRATDSLEAERSELETERAAQKDALAQLEAEQKTLDAKLAEAQARRQSLAAPTPAAAAPQGGGTAAIVEPAATTPSAPVPPAAYTPTAGEHPEHNHPFLVCTRDIESGGNYQAYNGAGPYLGAYQFLQSTWNSTANHAGRSELVGVDPRNASQYDQDDMAWTLYNWQGKGPWGGRC